MNVVVQIDGRDAIPVRAVLLATSGRVTPQGLALELSKPDTERKLTSYRHSQGKTTPVRGDAWAMQHEILMSIAHRFKRQEPEEQGLDSGMYREAAWRESLASLPAGVFVWLDELVRWRNERPNYNQYSAWEEVHRIVGEDDDPAPQFQLKRQKDTLDLSPIGLGDCEELICEGFEPYLIAQVTTPNPATERSAPVAVASDGPVPNAASNGPKFSMTKGGLISAHEHEWPTIRIDINGAANNGLAEAKAGARGWDEGNAMEWARAKGKLKPNTESSSSLSGAINRMAGLPVRKHKLKG